MATVDERRMQLADRLIAGHLPMGESSRQKLVDAFILGLSFQSAWLSASQLRMGGKLSPADKRELDSVRDALSSFGWEDLLDE